MTMRVAAITAAELVALTAAAVGGVVAVAPEPGHAAAATYGPGRRVPGVQIQRRVTATRIVVHVAVALGAHMPTVADDVRAAVTRALAEHLPEHDDWTVDVHISQVVDPHDPGDEGPP